MATTPTQLIDQSTRHAVHFERLKSGEVKELSRIIQQLQGITVARLANADDLTGFTLQRTRRFEAALRAALLEPMQDFDRQWRQIVLEAARYEADFEARNLRTAAVFEFDLPSANQLQSAVFSRPMSWRGPGGNLLLEPFVRDWERNTVDAVVNTVRLGYAQGLTNQQVIRQVRGAVDATGVLETSARQLSTIVRTSMQHASQMARQATWEANEDIVKKVRIVATLDDRTSSQCQSLDGLEFPLNEGPRPPFHPNCRTTTVPVLDERFKILEEGRTRAARDPDDRRVVEPVPAKQTYYEWLRNQDEEFQDSVIGPKRGKLLRDGGLSARRFAELQLGKTFEPLNLKEMKKLDPLAFRRAGVSVE
jgi:SPP1 gp7 family putative phage head morphogenesis protein